MSLKSALRSAGLGRLVYRLWHRPNGYVRSVIAAGGPLEVLRTERGRREMERAAHVAPPLPPPPPGAPTVHLLTGAKLWYQTVFFINTLGRFVPVRPIIHDDGSTDKTWMEWIKRALPCATIVSDAESEARLDQFLPQARYPSLRGRRLQYLLLRKLLDVHAGQTGWRIFFDSDMLVFRQPVMLADWLAAPKNCLHMTDVTRAYGYELPVLEGLAGRPVPDMVNTGVLGLQSDLIDWDRMEWYCRTLIERHGLHYYQEQALVALHLANQKYAALPRADYVVMPGEADAQSCGAIMHHYVANSKKWYFRHCWRVAMK